MKRTATVALLCAFVLSAAAPAFSQNKITSLKRPERVDGRSVDIDSDRPDGLELPDVKLRSRTRFADAEALTDGNGVLVRWTMAAEEKNAGFYIYRVENTEQPLNSSMIIGSWGTS